MTRVAALSSLLSEPVTPALARQALDQSPAGGPTSDGCHPRRRLPSVSAIQEAVCAVLGVSRQDLLSPRRTARVSRARQLAMYLARDLTSLSLAQIAREFDRDHTTVLHAIRTVSSRLEPGSETSTVLHRARQLLATPADAADPEPGSLHQPLDSPHQPSADPSRTIPR